MAWSGAAGSPRLDWQTKSGTDSCRACCLSSVSPCAISSRVQNHVLGDALQAPLLLLLVYVQNTSLFRSLVGSLPTRRLSVTGAGGSKEFCLLINKLRRECMWFLGWT